MAVVPSGWQYCRGSTYYKAGQTMPSPPQRGDTFGKEYKSSSGSTFCDWFYSYSNFTSIDAGIGWKFNFHDYYNVSLNNINNLIFDSINGADVVFIDLNLEGFGSTIAFNLTKFPKNVKRIEISCLDDDVKFSTFSIPTLPVSVKVIKFYGIEALESTPPLSHTQITSLSGAFKKCINLKSVTEFPSNLDSLYYTFSNCYSLTTIPEIPSSVKNFQHTFENCTSLIKAPKYTPNDTVYVHMDSTFKGCSNLNNIEDFVLPVDDPNWYRRYGSLFENCTSLVDASMLTLRSNTISRLFYGCSSLKYIPDIPNDVIDMSSTFEKCTSLSDVNIVMPPNIEKMSNVFKDCENLSGTIAFEDTSKLVLGSGSFDNTTKYIVFLKNYNVETFNKYNNIINNPILNINNVSTTRCDITGDLNDEGRYVKLSFDFLAIDFKNAKLCVPKIYIGNAQQQPQINWVYTDPEGIRHEIPNSTDIEIAYIEAATLTTTGSLETIFLADDNTTEYSIYLPVYKENIAQGYDNQGNVIRDRYYWNLLSGKAIFTGKDFIFDATPDGKSFKIGGPVDEENEKGFIVGERGIPLLADQYPSTFNGPVTFNSAVYGVGGGGPVGSIIQYGGAVEPDGWFICNGRELSRTTYAELFEAIGTTYGSGDGSSTFNIPDFRGRTAIGVSTDHAIGSSGGEEEHTLTADELASHTHGNKTLTGHFTQRNFGTGNAQMSWTSGVMSIARNNSTNGYNVASASNQAKMDTININASHTHDSVGNNTPHNNMQPYLTSNYIIKWKNVSSSQTGITVQEMADLLRPIGSMYKTHDGNFNPNTSWGGTWELLPEGYVLLSGSKSGSYIVGDDTSTGSGYKEYGENTHTLTVDEMPSHTHNVQIHYNAGSGSAYAVEVTSSAVKWGWRSDKIQNTGGGQAHNIMQKSIAVYWWIRTA